MLKTLPYSIYAFITIVIISCNNESTNQIKLTSTVDNVHLNLLENQSKIRKDFDIDSFYIIEYSFDRKEKHFEYNKDILYSDLKKDLLLYDEYYHNNTNYDKNVTSNSENSLDQTGGSPIYESINATLNNQGYITNYTITNNTHTTNWNYVYNRHGLLTERNLNKNEVIRKTQRFIYFSNNQKLYSSLIDSSYIPTIPPILYARDSNFLNIFNQIQKIEKQLNTDTYTIIINTK